ncbi:MAG: PEP-CTERM sorting domain-containing protein [Pirellulales bacterium]|nr:PEP-CTERM sorting domain-containing protein [Pirellulales bacterium]
MPSAGDEFDILDFGSLSGAFNTVQLPPLTGWLAWDTSQLYTTGVLAVRSTLLEADFDEDGDVDGADLVKWRASFGVSAAATHSQGDADGDQDVDGGDFLTWQRQLGSATTMAATEAVPEPAIPLLLISGALTTFFRRRVTVS